eukprot:gnl/TRDRNA2_/TRDRNA2_145789_c0_seq1.p1 gnl/TRDRNA2_/TRDRNA2_145789_c0~~gnl/TRDRNA2_/TRDRNA2_145789_c0_seq1.p1  ORF type:complete len:322 (+),score=50.55 gnl/TRDRNA2_/TRDRNA2_145789_c0_seq1:95-1060(+)
MHAVRNGSRPGIQNFAPAEPLDGSLVNAYLLRLGVERPCEPSLSALTELVAAHVDRIAYENIDMHIGRPPPPLDDSTSGLISAERIARNFRGGYCFILVDAFATLLCSLGFRVSLHTAACAADPPPPDAWGGHVVVLVHLDCGTYVADVGLGDGPRRPFKLAGCTWEEDGFHYALEERPGIGWRWTHDKTAGIPGFSVDTTTSAMGFGEFAAYHKWFWLDAASNFLKRGVVVFRKTASGVLMLHTCTLRRTHPGLPGGHEVLATPTSRDEWFALVRDTFFLPLEDLSEEERARLWSRVSADHTAWLERRRRRSSTRNMNKQ